MLRSLVGSEMCIRDRVSTQSTGRPPRTNMSASGIGKLEAAACEDQQMVEADALATPTMDFPLESTPGADIVSTLVSNLLNSADHGSFAVALSQHPPEISAAVTQLGHALVDLSQSADKLRNLTKQVHFVCNAPRGANMVVHAVTNNNILTTLNGASHHIFVDADYLMVGPATLEEKHVVDAAEHVVDNVRIHIESNDLQSVPTSLTFMSGTQYVLSDGYSVTYCGQRHRTVKMGIQ
eukprot:TRINITY_DN3480_c0_g1_i2.p1 TRINITY_DN3480_c0_g1~~TRINITY_DN3480_c0_g1_i2.p1  ORF type:complete len:252 (-),score=59.14 TRINITY_DN3480_c0_g1_i2:332-1042(-)